EQRGSAPTELALLAPVLVVLLLFIVFVGRLAAARLDVTAAARDAARAASLRATPADATADAELAARRTIAGRNLSCRTLDVIVDTTDLHPGGQVHVQVSCTTDLADLAVLQLPGSHRVTAEATEVVDRYGIQQ